MWNMREIRRLDVPLAFRYLIFSSFALRTDQRFPKRLFWTEIQVTGIRRYWVQLWRSPSAGCNQSAGRLYKGGCSLCPVGFVFSGSQHHQLAPCVFCLGRNSGLSVFEISFFWPVSTCLFPPPHPSLPVHFWFLETKGSVCFDPFCNLCFALLVS